MKKLSISKPDFENYYIDYVPLSSQDKLLPKILKQHKQISILKQQLELREKEINQTINKMISED